MFCGKAVLKFLYKTNKALFQIFPCKLCKNLGNSYHIEPHMKGFFCLFILNIFMTFVMHNGRFIRIFKNCQTIFSQENSFLPNLGKKGPKWPQNKFFMDFLKNLSLFFLGNDLKWKLILLLIFYDQSHIWQNSGFRVMAQNAVG